MSTAAQTRLPGFYWCRRERWEVAEWIAGEHGYPPCWRVTTSKFAHDDANFVEIDERPIERQP